MKEAIINRLFVSILFLVIPVISQAHVMKPDELITKIIESNQSIRAAYLRLNVRVFDPEAQASLHEDIVESSVPLELVEKNFNQDVVWIRDEFIGIETKSTDKKPLHALIQVAGSRFSENLTTDRYFVDEDVINPSLFFFTKYESTIKETLDNFGIGHNQVALEKKDFNVFYRLGDDKSFVLVNASTFNIEQLSFEIAIQGRNFPVLIVFEEWDLKFKRIPTLIRYFINGRQFKEVYVEDIGYRGIWRKRRNLLKTYKSQIKNPFKFSPKTDFSR